MSNRTKPQQLGDWLQIKRSLVCIISETWLKSDVMNAEIDIDSNNLHISDRLSRGGDGVCA